MLIITWYDNGVSEVAGESNSIIALAHMFENHKIQFKIHGGGKYYEQKNFGVGGFEYWLKAADSFTGG